MTKEHVLPRFRAAIEAHENEISAATYWRYRNGRLPPPLGPLLLRYPDLARALAEDAAELALNQTTQQTNDAERAA